VFIMIVSQMKQLNDHKVTFRVDLESGVEVHAFLSSYRQKTAQASHVLQAILKNILVCSNSNFF